MRMNACNVRRPMSNVLRSKNSPAPGAINVGSDSTYFTVVDPEDQIECKKWKRGVRPAICDSNNLAD